MQHMHYEMQHNLQHEIVYPSLFQGGIFVLLYVNPRGAIQNDLNLKSLIPIFIK